MTSNWSTASMSSSACRMIMRDVSRSKYSSAVLPLTETAPVPALIQTRAMAVLRLPVAYVRVSAVAIVLRFLEFNGERLGLLGRVRVVGRRVDLELGQHSPPENVLGEH